MKKEGQQSFVIYHDWYDNIKDFEDADLGKLLRAMFEHEINRKVTTKLDSMSAMAFRFFTQALNRNREKYKEKCERNRANQQARWDKTKVDTPVYDRKRSNTLATDNDSINDREPYNGSESENGSEPGNGSKPGNEKQG